jgi:hypothetical protein
MVISPVRGEFGAVIWLRFLAKTLAQVPIWTESPKIALFCSDLL